MNIGESNLVMEVSLLLFLRMLEASVDLNSLTFLSEYILA